jgi:uncharacterized YigZ family protein
MSVSSRYPIPAARHRVEQTVTKSRFIATVGQAATVEEARAFIDDVSQAFPDASHNCWAYVVGPPGDSSRVGMSDAGEPHGTAGRPMLDVLLGSGIGDIVAVVTRYFGGVKLGKGGLSRAYSGAVKLALEDLELEERVRKVYLRIRAGYADVTPLKRALPSFEASVVEEEYGTGVVVTVLLPDEHADAFSAALAGMTNGTAEVDRL